MAYQNKSASKKSLFALLFAFLGAVVMIALVTAMNKDAGKKEEKVDKQSRIVNVKTVKKPPQSKPKPKPKPKPKKATPKAPLPNLNSIMSGISMNIPEFATGNIAGDGSDLLDEIAEDAIMNEDTVDSKPKVLSRTPMEFPVQAAKEGIKGYVIINLLIDKDGSVELAKILESQPNGVFDDTAINGVRSWRFSPAMYRGKPVKIWAKQKIKFD
jgi:protein TonB